MAKPIRLVITDGTKVAAAFAAKNPKKGTKFTALGIPRVNLDRLMDEVQQAGAPVPGRGAYEMIVIGIR